VRVCPYEAEKKTEDKGARKKGKSSGPRPNTVTAKIQPPEKTNTQGPKRKARPGKENYKKRGPRKIVRGNQRVGV